MAEVILYIILGLIGMWLVASLAIAKESLWNLLTDLPSRFTDWLQRRRERRERRRIFLARQARVKAVFNAINRREF